MLSTLDELIYVFDGKLRNYPRNLKKGLKHHEKILKEVLNERINEVSKLIPSLNVVKGETIS